MVYVVAINKTKTNEAKMNAFINKIIIDQDIFTIHFYLTVFDRFYIIL